MRKMILAIEVSSTRREVISAMVNDVLVEICDGGSVKQVREKEGKKGEGWAEETCKGRQVDLKMGTLKRRR